MTDFEEGENISTDNIGPWGCAFNSLFLTPVLLSILKAPRDIPHHNDIVPVTFSQIEEPGTEEREKKRGRHKV